MSKRINEMTKQERKNVKKSKFQLDLECRDRKDAINSLSLLVELVNHSRKKDNMLSSVAFDKMTTMLANDIRFKIETHNY